MPHSARSSPLVEEHAEVLEDFLGVYLSLADLQTAHPTAHLGDRATVNVGGTPIEYYWSDQTNQWMTGLDGKSSVGHTHSTGQVVGLDAALAGKSAVGHTHSTSQITGLDGALAAKSAVGHTHNYTEITGLTGALAGKANSSHSHPTYQVSGLEERLAILEPAPYGRWAADRSFSAARATDLTGHGRHLTQSNAAKRPTKTTLGEVTCWSFDGSNDFWDLPSPPELLEFTVAVVFRLSTNPSGYCGLVEAWNTNGFFLAVNAYGAAVDGKLRLTLGGQSDIIHPYAVNVSSWLLAVARADGTTAKLLIHNHGEESAAKTTSAAPAFRISGNAAITYSFPGEIAEAILFDRYLSDQETTNLTANIGYRYTLA